MFKNLMKFAFSGILLCGIIIAGIVFFTNGVSSREVGVFNQGELWRDADESLFIASGERQIVPDKYRTLSLNKEALQTLLVNAPLESRVGVVNSESVISLPLPDGKFSRFRFVESPTMEESLQAQYPEIRTYLGQGIDVPEATVRFDFTPHGFHAMILSSDDSVFIDPYAKNDTDNYIAYYKRDFQKSDRSFMCEVGNGVPNALEKKHLDDKILGEDNLVNNAGTLRTYRLAMAATGEYTAFHGGTVPLALAAINTTMNRVNGVYEKDLSVRMTLVANNSLIIYTNAGTDPYANTSGDLNANQTNINTVIGTANYDVGHLVGTGGGGVAQLNSPCGTSKARGLTGSPAPVGDPFDIDYVAHEMGHQFGGNHTFNGTTGSCGGGNRSTTASFEPGSGATIQAYAGICGTQDLQRNSDDYFHIRSLEEMTTFITNAGTGGSCDVETATGNVAPVVTAASACTIPINTPFELTGSATDANGDSLTYTWEEYDLGAATTAIPNTDASGGARPIFRSYKPTATGATRSFPSLPFILNNANVPPSTFSGTNPVGTFCSSGNCLTGELMPSISRTMQFQLTARDNRAGGGGVRSAQTTVTVSNTSGPFAVTSPNTAVSYSGLSSQTITWNVASTTAAPVSCANVDILISTNGGTTFTTLLANTPNDGTQSVTIPNTGTTTARIKIKCATSCFFDISNTNFTILAPTAANASLGGRVLTAQGIGISNAKITLTDAQGNTRIIKTNAFGYYSFDELATGAAYTLNISRKGYTFAQPTQFITLNEDFGEANFTAE